MIDITKIDIDSIFIPETFITCYTFEQFEFMCILGHQLNHRWANGERFTHEIQKHFIPDYGINIIEGCVYDGNMPFDSVIPLYYFEEWQKERREEHFESSMKLMEAVIYEDLPDFVDSILNSRLGI